MGWLDLRVWFKDRFYDRELLSVKTLGLEEAVNMLSSPKIEISDLLFDFKDTSQLADSPCSFVKRYFKPEDIGFGNSITYSILRSRGDGAVHRLSMMYFLQDKEKLDAEGVNLTGSLMNPGVFPYHDDSKHGFQTIRRAIIDFYQKDGMHVLNSQYAIDKLTLHLA